MAKPRGPPSHRAGQTPKSKKKVKEPFDIDWISYFLFVAVPITVSIFVGYYYYRDMMRNLVIKPLDFPRVINTTQPRWGTYRPGLYFGVKSTHPNSPVSGLMWYEQQLNPHAHRVPLRHLCKQDDRLSHYSWQKHNGDDFGVQNILDEDYKVTTEFIRTSEKSWKSRFTVSKLPHTRKGKAATLMYYYATECSNQISVSSRIAHVSVDSLNLASLAGSDPVFGEYEMTFTDSGGALTNSYYIGYTPGYEQIEDIVNSRLGLTTYKDTLFMQLFGQDNIPEQGYENLFIHSVTGTLPFTLEVDFHPKSQEHTTTNFNTMLRQHIQQFDQRFERVFQLKAKGFDDEHISFAQMALSNMIGGIGYFYGSSIVQSKYNPEPVWYWKSGLFTAVPSRSFFPRGFLWDEGFHNLLIREWDEKLSMEIIGHWMDLMNAEGWIPREQILDAEARKRVPSEFVVQRNENANPPTFFLPLETIVENLIKQNTGESNNYLKRIFPRLQTWYNWFNLTQIGSQSGTYRWRGRNPDAVREINPKTLTSGLDDYPRASHPTDEEKHLDLRCWIALASRVMAKIAKNLGQYHHTYEATYRMLSDNDELNKHHWSEVSHRYADYGLHSDAIKLKRPPPPKNLQPGQPIPHRDLERFVSTEPTLKLVVSHFGYNSLFPLLTQILNADSPQLGYVLRDLYDRSLIWTDYGLRSLSKKSPLYQKRNTEHDPPYWRGAIWININYLALRSLHHYGNVEGPHREKSAKVYKELRDNVINNLFNQYKKTGYIWEQYDDRTGQGKGCHPFTGWSALVTLIMAEKY